MMNREDLVQRVAPCGLSCELCVSFAQGPVREHARELAALLGGNFATYAARFTALNPVFAKYGDFRELLEYLASGSCTGCRGSGCLFAACRVTRCVRDKGVEFCFQCAQFPCDGHGMPPLLAERWRKNNERLQTMGLEAYYEMIKDKPRYP